MIRALLKIVLLGVAGFALYKGGEIYSAIRWSSYVADCAGEVRMCELGRQRAPDQQVAAAVAEMYACVDKRQPALESVFVRLPKSHADISSDPLDHKYAADFCRFTKAP